MNNKLLLLTCATATVFLCSCEKTVNVERPVRSDYITVYEQSPDKPLNDVQVPFEGVTDGQIHVLSNVSLQWKYMVDQKLNADPDHKDWFKIKSVDEIEPGHTVITYDAASLLVLNDLSRREGKLSFCNPALSFGKFMSVSQGYDYRVGESFDDQDGQSLCITGTDSYTTREYPELNTDFYEYIAFNAWAKTDNEFLSKNITLDISVSGGKFHDTDLTTYRVNVPLGTKAETSNLKYLLIMGNGERMSAKTTFTFSTANDNQVYVYVDNFAIYRVSEAEIGYLIDDEEVIEDDDIDWI